MVYISKALRQFVTERAQDQCEYCQAQRLVVMLMAVDHIFPHALGGPTTAENLCLACIHCNSHKREFITGFDPETERQVRLFNPRKDNWTTHFSWSDDGIELSGLSDVGRATVIRLQINRPDILESRRIWVDVGWHPPKKQS